MCPSIWLLYEFPGDDHARIGLVIHPTWDSVAWAYYILRNVAINGHRPDPLAGVWYCEATP